MFDGVVANPPVSSARYLDPATVSWAFPMSFSAMVLRSPLDSAGKRAAFAGFYAPLHFLTGSAILGALVMQSHGRYSAIGAAAAMTWRGGGSSGDAALSPGSPDMLNAAMQFVLVAAVVMVLAHYVYIYAGGAGIIASGLLSGAIDVDAATLSASRLANAGAGGANLQAAGISVGAAIVANTMVKAGIAYAQGSREMAKAAIAALAASGVATCLGLAIAVWLT